MDEREIRICKQRRRSSSFCQSSSFGWRITVCLRAVSSSEQSEEGGSRGSGYMSYSVATSSSRDCILRQRRVNTCQIFCGVVRLKTVDESSKLCCRHTLPGSSRSTRLAREIYHSGATVHGNGISMPPYAPASTG